MSESFIVFADLPSWKVVKNAYVNSENAQVMVKNA